MAHVDARESQWLSAHAVNNVVVPRNVPLEAWRRTLGEQRLHAGRLQLAVVLYAYGLEPRDPAAAHAMRGAGRGFGSLANFLGDEECIGFISQRRHERLHLAAITTSARALTELPESSAPLRRELQTMFDDYFSVRESGEWTPAFGGNLPAHEEDAGSLGPLRRAFTVITCGR